MPKVSVLMPVRNAMPHLALALAFLELQTFRDFEAVVVDDASDDRVTHEAIEQWLVRLPMRVLYMSSPFGVTHCLTVGLANCTGQYVARHDADDASFQERFEEQVRYLDAHPNVVALGTRVEYMDDKDGFIREQSLRAIRFPTLQLRLGWNRFVHGSLMMRRDAMIQVGGYRDTFEKSQDVDLLLRLAKVGKLAILPDVLYSVRQHAGQVSVQHRDEQRCWATAARWGNL